MNNPDNKEQTNNESVKEEVTQNVDNTFEQPEISKDSDSSKEQEQDSKQTSGTNIKEINESVANVAQTQSISQVFNFPESYAANILREESGGHSLRFSKQMLKAVEANEIEKFLCYSNFYIEPADLQNGAELLKKHGLLVIKGSSKASLQEVSFLIANYIKNNNIIHNLFVCEPLGKPIRINFNTDLTKPSNELNNSILIFKDPTKKHNIDFKDLFDQLCNQADFGQNISFLKDLKKKRTFLILVVEKETNISYQKIEKAPYTLNIEKPSEELKTQYFLNRLESLKKQTKLKEEQLTFFEQNASIFSPTFVSQLEYIFDINQFIELLEREIRQNSDLVLSKDLFQLLVRQVNDIKLWLVDKIGKDIKDWSFVLSLSLLGSVPDLDYFGVSIIDFELFRTKLEDFLVTHSKLKIEKENWPEIQTESLLLEKYKVVKEKNIANGRIYLSFREENIANEIWKVLTEELSLNLIQIIPFLLKLIEEGIQASNAARILGRIGEVDQSQTLSWIAFFSNQTNVKQRVMVGYLFHGIHASNNEIYINRCEQLLKKYSQSNSFEKVWSAVAAYKQIGIYRTEYALGRLGDIVEKKLIPPYKELKKIRSRQSWSFNKLQIFSSIKIEELEEILSTTTNLENKVKELENHEAIFKSITFSISALCINLEPLSVFEYWMKWMDSNNLYMKIFFIKILLLKGGVLDQLDRQVSFLNEETELFEDWHYMVMVISYGEKAHNLLLNLLEKVVKGIEEMESAEKRAMEDSLIKYLSRWAEASLDIGEAREQIIDFLGNVLYKLPTIYRAFNTKIKNWSKNDKIKFRTLVPEIENAIDTHKSKAQKRTKIDIGKIEI